MREQLEKLLKETEAAHDTNSKAYRKALAARDAANVAVRDACDVASKTANELASLRKAVA